MRSLLAINTQLYPAPCGTLLIGAADTHLCICDWVRQDSSCRSLDKITRCSGATVTDCPSAATGSVARWLDSYFEGKNMDADFQLMFFGSDFQKRVWLALLAVGYGTTATYADIAERIGRPTAIRAVANAIGANPLTIIVPCHRVIGSDGSMTGYSGGIDKKRFLLNLELSHRNQPTL